MKTFSDILAKLKESQCWYWHDDYSRGASLSITIDNLPADRRHCYEIRIPRETSRRVTVELRVLKNYDPVKNVWSEYIPQDARSGDIETRRGEKALREYVREIAVILKGVPRPQFLSFTEWSDAPRIAEARESAAYLERISRA